jgi:hypothetical protein
MNRRESEFVNSINAVIEEGERLHWVVRDSELQRSACERLQDKLTEILREKQLAVQKQDEDYANCLLGCECAARAVLAELYMWLQLKDQHPDEAWNQLVNAESLLLSAMRAHPGFSHLTAHIERLQVVEDVIFPPQVFVSAGLTVEEQTCSICGEEYGECEHLAGKPYMGEFCAIITGAFKANHVAIVDSPADKRCRITHCETGEGVRNRMTLEIVEPRSEDWNPDEGLRTRAILMVADKSFDVNPGDLPRLREP